MSEHDGYVPALGVDRLTPLYDPLMKLFMREQRFKRRLIQQANIANGHRVLDLGCGTGTLTILIKENHPEAEVIGLDGDSKILEIARMKASKSGTDISFEHGMAFQLPYPDHSFDRVLSSLVLHHLTTEDKQRALGEVCRILKATGELHVADFGKPHNAFAYAISLLLRHFERTSTNLQGLLPEMFRRAGLDQVETTAEYMTVFGTLTLYKGRKPG